MGLTNTGGSLNPTQEFLNNPTVAAVGQNGAVTLTGSGFSRTVTVPTSTNGTSGVVTVTYTNSLKTGVVEACKSIVAGSGLTGSWQFTITGGNGYSSVQNVTAGTCSPPVTVPAGKVIVQETGDASESVTSITATQGALPGTNAILGPLAGPAGNLDTATVVAAVQAGDASVQTIVTMTNNSVRLKLCKYVDQGLTNTGPYTFRFGTVTGNAGPIGPISPVSITAGTAAAPICTVVGTYRAGTTVPITEDIIAGTKVGSITVNPATDAYDGSPTVVPGTLSTANRTVTVQLGAGETVVTYQDVPASPGTLKICKVAGSLSTAGARNAVVHVHGHTPDRLTDHALAAAGRVRSRRNLPLRHDPGDRRGRRTEHDGPVDHGSPGIRDRERRQHQPARTLEHGAGDPLDVGNDR